MRAGARMTVRWPVTPGFAAARAQVEVVGLKTRSNYDVRLTGLTCPFSITIFDIGHSPREACASTRSQNVHAGHLARMSLPGPCVH